MQYKNGQKDIDDFTESDKLKSNFIMWNYRRDTTLIGTFNEWEIDSFGEHAVLLIPKLAEDFTDGTLTMLHLPNLVVLNNKLKNAKISSGDKIKIVYIGDKLNAKTRRTYGDFEIFIKRISES